MSKKKSFTPEEEMDFEERAAIREYDGGQPRYVAEYEARKEIIARRKKQGELWKQ